MKNRYIVPEADEGEGEGKVRGKKREDGEQERRSKGLAVQYVTAGSPRRRRTDLQNAGCPWPVSRLPPLTVPSLDAERRVRQR